MSEEHIRVGLYKAFYKKLVKEPKVMALIQRDRELDVMVEKIKLLESLKDVERE